MLNIRNKKDELRYIEEKLNIFCNTEMWVNENLFGDSLQEFKI